MPTELMIKAEIGRVNSVLRQHLTADELALIAEAWGVTLTGLSDAELERAVNERLRQSRFFPTPADILKAHDEITATRRNGRLALAALPEAGGSKEEQRRNAICAKMLSLGLREPAAREFFRMRDWVAREALARRMLGKRYPEVVRAVAEGGGV